MASTSYSPEPMSPKAKAKAAAAGRATARMRRLDLVARNTSGISGTGGRNVNKDYKETGTQKSFLEKLKYAFRTIPVESPETIAFYKQLEIDRQNNKKKKK
jgi:hypothetical protein